MDPVQGFFFLQAEVGDGEETLVAPGPTQMQPFEVGAKCPCLLSIFSVGIVPELRTISLSLSLKCEVSLYQEQTHS